MLRGNLSLADIEGRARNLAGAGVGHEDGSLRIDVSWAGGVHIHILADRPTAEPSTPAATAELDHVAILVDDLTAMTARRTAIRVRH